MNEIIPKFPFGKKWVLIRKPIMRTNIIGRVNQPQTGHRAIFVVKKVKIAVMVSVGMTVGQYTSHSRSILRM